MGDGAIFNHLPHGAQWCEIQKGKDFFLWSEPVDWIISNPPYSLLTAWLNHSYQVAENIVYLIPIDSFFVSFAKMKACIQYGWLKHIRVYGVGKQLGFPTGKTMGAVHFKRSYSGATSWSWYAPNIGVHSRLATVAQDGQDLRTV